MKIYLKILSEGSKRQTVIHFPPEIRPGVKTLANPAFNSGFLFCTRDISYHFSATTKYISPVLDPESPPCAPSLGVTESQTGSKMHEIRAGKASAKILVSVTGALAEGVVRLSCTSHLSYWWRSAWLSGGHALSKVPASVRDAPIRIFLELLLFIFLCSLAGTPRKEVPVFHTNFEGGGGGVACSLSPVFHSSLGQGISSTTSLAQKHQQPLRS